MTTTAPVALQVQEFSGVAAAGHVDGAIGTAATSQLGELGHRDARRAGNDLAVGFAAGHANAQAMTVTSPGYTVGPQQTTTGPSAVSVISGYQVLSGTSAQAFSASFAQHHVLVGRASPCSRPPRRHRRTTSPSAANPTTLSR